MKLQFEYFFTNIVFVSVAIQNDDKKSMFAYVYLSKLVDIRICIFIAVAHARYDLSYDAHSWFV